MIDFQSVFCVGRPNSPKGCGRLAGDNIPGHQPNDPSALEGRWRELISFASVPLCKTPRNCKTNPIFNTSCYQSKRSAENFAQIMINQTHSIAGESPLPRHSLKPF